MNAKNNSYKKYNPLLVGFFALLVTVLFGMSIAFSMGLVTPAQVFAQVVTASPCCAILPPPPIIVLPAASVVNPMPPASILGCTDPHATNYKSNATQEDGSCTYPPPPPPPPPAQPVWTNYCTGADDPHPWQIWAHDDSTPQNYKYVGTDPSCAPPPPPPPPPPPSPKAPTCTLSASPASVSTGGHSTLSWTTANADTASIDHGVGAATPVAAGSTSVSPSSSITYTLTATGAGGSVTCPATVTVTSTPPPPPTKPSCTLSASPASVSTGGHSTLSWTTSDSVSFSIDHSIGEMTPVASGATSTPALSADTTFTGTVTDASGNIAVCTASVTVSGGGGGGGGPTCTMTASPSSISSGGHATLTWGGSEISSVDIDNDIATATTSPGSTSVAPAGAGSHTYVGTFHANNGQTLTCSATVQVTGGGGGCTGNCGGGSTPPTVTLASLPHIGAQPLAYLYLSQIPYTGLDLGPVGTAMYWLALTCVALAASYLILFSAVPFARRSVYSFVARVSGVLNAPEPAPSGAASAAPREAPAAPEPHEKLLEAPRGYSSYDGFRSFAHNGALSIEDLVKGLSREHAARVAARTEPVSAPEADAAPMQANVEPIFEHVEIIQDGPPEGSLPSGASTDVRGFAAALVEGDRAGVFAGLRQYVRGGGAPERLISSVACLVDDAYRARIDGSPCDATMARLTARLDTPTLEKLVVALTTAIDSSYSDNVSGAKLALTRALAVLGA